MKRNPDNPRGANKEYDERQLKIRGNIYQRGFIMMAMATLANSALLEFGLRWANPFWANLTILMLVMTATTVEMIVRDAYIGVRSQFSANTLIVLFGLIAALNMGINIHALWTGQSFLERNTLSRTGIVLIFWSIYMVIPIALLAKRVAERRNQKRGEGE